MTNEARTSKLDGMMRLAAWACLLALAVLSLLPKEEMVRTGFDNHLEHFVAWAGSTLFVAWTYRRRVGLVPLSALLVSYAGLLEMGQLLSPGRHASVWDWAAGSCGVVCIALAFAMLDRPISGRLTLAATGAPPDRAV